MDYHLIIIGGGAAGKDAALFAARAGIKTLLVEKDQLGGTSYQRGCYAMRALQACASPGLFYDAAIGSDLGQALTALFAAVTQPGHLTQ